MKHLKTKHWISGTDYRLRCVCFYFSSFMIVLLVLSFFTVGCILCVIINDCTGLFGLCVPACAVLQNVYVGVLSLSHFSILFDTWWWFWELSWEQSSVGTVGDGNDCYGDGVQSYGDGLGMGTMLKIVMGMGWGWGWQVQGRLGMGTSICAHAAL